MVSHAGLRNFELLLFYFKFGTVVGCHLGNPAQAVGMIHLKFAKKHKKKSPS